MVFLSNHFFRSRALQGFSLGEVILAAFILTTGLLSVTGLIVSSFRNSTASRDAIIAIALAQEGIELVRNVRDNDFVQGSGGDGFPEEVFSPSHTIKTHCRFSYDGSKSCSGQSNWAPSADPDRYYLQHTNGFYQHINNGSREKYSRYIHIDFDDEDVNNKTAKVLSFVYWGVDDVPDNIENGDASECTVANMCVYSEVFLTSWN